MYESESAIDAVKIELPDTFYHGTGVMLLDQSSVSFYKELYRRFYSFTKTVINWDIE